MIRSTGIILMFFNTLLSNLLTMILQYFVGCTCKISFASICQVSFYNGNKTCCSCCYCPCFTNSCDSCMEVLSVGVIYKPLEEWNDGDLIHIHGRHYIFPKCTETWDQIQNLYFIWSRNIVSRTNSLLMISKQPQTFRGTLLYQRSWMLNL